MFRNVYVQRKIGKFDLRSAQTGNKQAVEGFRLKQQLQQVHQSSLQDVQVPKRQTVEWMVRYREEEVLEEP